jgi:hypothetical protein
MSPRILHLLDPTTPADALDILALLYGKIDKVQRLAALGDRTTADLAQLAGIDGSQIKFLHSMGWADPTGWRSLRRLIREFSPTHVHAWGIPAAVAASMVRFKGQRLVTLCDLPRPTHLRLLPMIHKGGVTGLMPAASPCRWIVTTSWLKRELHAHAIAADAVCLIRQPLPAAGPETSKSDLQIELGLLPEDGPLLLLGGEGGTGSVLAAPGLDSRNQGGPRHDLGLWAAAILQQIFPRIRAIVREDPRGRVDPGLVRFMNDLPDTNIVVAAPGNWTWGKLLSIADLLLVTPDGPFAAGSVVHAFGAKVPVVGTPVDSVREYITEGTTGLLTAACRPRAIAAGVEALLAQIDVRQRVMEQAHLEALGRFDPEAVVRAYAGHYQAEAGELAVRVAVPA